MEWVAIEYIGWCGTSGAIKGWRNSSSGRYLKLILIVVDRKVFWTLWELVESVLWFIRYDNEWPTKYGPHLTSCVFEWVDKQIIIKCDRRSDKNKKEGRTNLMEHCICLLRDWRWVGERWIGFILNIRALDERIRRVHGYGWECVFVGEVMIEWRT